MFVLLKRNNPTKYINLIKNKWIIYIFNTRFQSKHGLRIKGKKLYNENIVITKIFLRFKK